MDIHHLTNVTSASDMSKIGAKSAREFQANGKIVAFGSSNSTMYYNSR